MLRQDFQDIFSYIIKNTATYSINTNGTLINPSIAALMKNKGAKMIAIYGATKEVHDKITNCPGSFEAALRGMAYLKEAGANFAVQLVPMKANYVQLSDMMRLAESISPYWRIGASWLFLSSSGNRNRNNEIRAQRLSPRQAANLDTSYEYCADHDSPPAAADSLALFEPCILNRRAFHIDPYGNMTFCSFIKDPSLLYDLRKGTFKECWEVFLPSLLKTFRTRTYNLGKCFSCEVRRSCQWCPAYAYLEHRDYTAKISYLCNIANIFAAKKHLREQRHINDIYVADLRFRICSDIPINNNLQSSRISDNPPDPPTVKLWHYHSLKGLKLSLLSKPIYRRNYWSVFTKGRSWIYIGSKFGGKELPEIVAVFNYEHTRGKIYNNKEFDPNAMNTITMSSLDRSLLSWIIGFRSGCIFRASSFILDNKGIGLLGLPLNHIYGADNIPSRNITPSQHLSIIRSHSGQLLIYPAIPKLGIA